MPLITQPTSVGTITVNSTATPTPGLVAAPVWMQALVIGEWQPLSTNLLKDVDPEDVAGVNPNYPANAPWHGVEGQAGQLIAWTGGALAKPGTYNTHGALIVGAGGGHASYGGSEFYALDLGTRLWTRLTNPYPTPDMGSYIGTTTWPYMSTRYPDGSPVPPHTYDQVQYHPGSKTVWLLRGRRDNHEGGSSNAAGIPNHTSNGNGLKLDTLAFRHTPEAYVGGNTFSLAGRSGQKSCYDSIRDCFWMIYNGSASGSGGFDLWKIYDLDVQNGDGSYAKWQRYTIRAPGEIQSCMRHDPVDDLLIFDDFRDPAKRIYVYECAKAGIDYNANVVTQSGTFPTERADQAGWDWSPGLRSMVYIQPLAGADLYRCAKPATDWKNNPWVWSKLTAPTNTHAVPVAQGESGVIYRNGIYGRLRVVQYAGMEVVVVVTRRDLPAYIMRIT